MRGALPIAVALAAGGLALGGCTLLFGPDRDLSRDDAGSDAGGFDAGLDGGGDGGTDGGGGDAGCPGSQGIETSCTNGEDDDCNGLVDCNDFACRASPACCDTMSTTPWPDIGPYDSGLWARDGEPGLPMVTSSTVDFGTAGYPQALVLNECAPLAFGADFDLSFAVTPGMRGDFAALLLSPVSSRGGMSPFLAELAVRVFDDGEVRLERAGTTVRSEMIAGAMITVRVSLRPGVDDANRGVLRATVEAGGTMFADDLPFLLLSDLRGPPTCAPDGLFVVLEGQGTNVTVSSQTNAGLLSCENPSQFLPDQSTPDLGDMVDELAPDTGWRTGGVGEPSVAHVDTGVDRLELWIDAAETERADEFLRRIDFTLGATRHQSGGWAPRLLMGGAPTLFGPSTREPSVAAPVDSLGRPGGSNFYVAFAQRRPMNPDLYDVELRSVPFAEPVTPLAPQTLLVPIAVDCASLRDPSIVVLGENERDDLLLFYTCERQGARDAIGAARFAWNAVDGEYQRVVHESRLLTADVGGYAARGVFSPEAVFIPASPPMEPDARIRLWFLSRDASGEVAMSTAFGTIQDGLPTLSPYPGNPTLRAEDAILGGDCSIGCSIDAMGVTRTLPGSRWSEPSYLLVVAHSRQTVTGVDHELVRILQRRPNNE